MYVQAGTAASVFSAQGVIQAHSTGHTGMSMYLDLVNTGTNNNTWKPAGFYADNSLTTETPAASSTDTAGFTPRDLWVWAGVTVGGSTVSSVPTPQASWTGPVTSALMNGPSGPVQALTLLNNPPALRVSQALTTSISNNTRDDGAVHHARHDRHLLGVRDRHLRLHGPPEWPVPDVPHHQLRLQRHRGTVRGTVGHLWYGHHGPPGPRLRRLRRRGHVRHRRPGP